MYVLIKYYNPLLVRSSRAVMLGFLPHDLSWQVSQQRLPLQSCKTFLSGRLSIARVFRLIASIYNLPKMEGGVTPINCSSPSQFCLKFRLYAVNRCSAHTARFVPI